ncbi:MAG TPA: hypothetical protein VMV92_00915 [Streptosporangiaceae bacterium]|nr:hypothetical protein [Streptosporangiaceae bacterium]
MDPDDSPQQRPPVVCDMTSAPDTPAARIDEYRRLFTQSLLGRSRTGNGITFRFRADPGLDEWVRDLARREKACCAFFHFTVKASGQVSAARASSPPRRTGMAAMDRCCEKLWAAPWPARAGT